MPSYQVYQGGPGQAEQETLTCEDEAGIFFLADLKRILERYGNRAANGPPKVEAGAIGGTGRVRGPRGEQGPLPDD